MSMNIEKLQNGFKFNNNTYSVEGEIDVISETQCHIVTNLGTILFDTSISIDNVSFSNIEDFIQTLTQ